MPRERSTWNVNAIAKRAGLKVADPYLMNQDHVNQQPSADQYVIGGPSEFAEDVHPSNNTWEAEYAGGQVKRNEIGMPEMRSDTFNHPEKTASEEVITKKAALCVAIARKILPKTASAAEIEDQSYSFMYLPDAEVMATYTRLASQDDLQGDQSQQKQVQAAQQQAQQDQAQQVQAAQQQDQAQQGQQVQAGQIPPQFLENVKKKKEEAADKKDDDGGEKKEDKKAAQDQQQAGQDQGQQGQQKQAQQDQGQQDQGQTQQKQAQQDQDQAQQVQDKQAGMQQQIAQLLQQAQQIQQQLAQGQQQTQQPVAQMQQQSQAQQIAQAVQQAIAQGQDPIQAAQQCLGQTQQQSNNEIDQMLAEQGQIEPMANMDIQLDTPSMDVGEVQLTPDEDDTLRQLFANNPEYKNAQEAAGQGQDDQGQQGQQKQAHVVRTASMRTVGTRPTAGVSQIGGVSSNAGAGAGRDLSSLWNSAPDVREVFGMRTDQ